MRSKGIPERVIDLAKRPQRLTTAGMYDGHWGYFVDFCRDKDYNLLAASESSIAAYLLYLFDRGCAPLSRSIEAISSVLKHVYPKIFKSVLIGDLLSRFNLERPREKRLSKFDIYLVLEQLMKPPFVDSHVSDLGIPKLLFAYKTAF